MEKFTVILADGRFPIHEVPLYYLKHAKQIVCCDGATYKLLKYGMEPNAIIGDMDSISPELKEKYVDILHPIISQEDNDLTKAVNFCADKGWDNIVILGATGLREDHAIGNISLLAQYAAKLHVKMVTNYGTFTAIQATTTFKSFDKQQVSIFSLDPDVEVESEHLRYPLKGVVLNSWWKGTLNESIGSTFTLSLKKEKRLIVFQTHSPK